MAVFRAGLILKKAEQERAFFRFPGGVTPVEIPQKRLTRSAGLDVLLGTPNGPERREIAFDARIVGQERLEHTENLEAVSPLEIAPGGEQGPKSDFPQSPPGLGVSHRNI